MGRWYTSGFRTCWTSFTPGGASTAAKSWTRWWHGTGRRTRSTRRGPRGEIRLFSRFREPLSIGWARHVDTVPGHMVRYPPTFQAEESMGEVRERFTFSVRFGPEGRSREFRIGRTGLIATAAVLGLFFVLMTQIIYDYRETLSKARELRSLRQRVSEQNLTLYNLYAKFESLETEVERIRTLDVRVRWLVRINEALLPGGRKNSGGTGVGGAETPESAAATRLDSLLDLRVDRLKESILGDGKNMEDIYEYIHVR